MIGLDTNVVARYVLEDDEAQLVTATEVMESLSLDNPGFVTHVTLVELEWIMNRGYRIPRDSRLKVLRALIETETLEFEDGESVVRALALAEEGADFADALIAASGELFGIPEFVTFDRGAARHLGWTLLN
ncbi:PIN domain-containing protein [Microbacterium hominis]|uniref:Type II toxin-antitoxin system VapC family toxin n=1 Tax=Microbacterium hominis TaxID=162426 RepID=A0A7D4QE87_9MICO|nr:type II toxin-antitoxin system VapC family toxin [Microbacterium hominis]QKJ20837.1 type II toxin-antitoxin system VapC family toxin [Microbacterium hominis]